jgi:hypothetical protein
MNTSTKAEFAGVATAEPSLTCGLIMPISGIDSCPAEHWSDVKQILQDAIEAVASPKFTARLVSDADDVGVIQKRIVQGVYNSDLVVCDVSGKNPNVMFELGMRLAFDRPTIIVKDDKTDYSFDTGVIEHLTYPRDLRFARIIAFKKLLADKIVATYSAAKGDPQHSTFLKSFGTFKVANLEQKEAPGEQLMLEMLQDVQKELAVLRRNTSRQSQRMKDSYTQDPAIIMALLEMKRADPSLLLDGSSVLMDALMAKDMDTTRPYSSKAAYTDAFRASCEIANLRSPYQGNP